MTFPHKDDLIFFEKLIPKQIRIYNDACDEGIPISEFPVEAGRIHLKVLMEFYGYAKDRWAHGSSEVRVFIPVEKADYKDGYDGIVLKVGFCRDPSYKKEYVYIQESRDTCDESRGRNLYGHKLRLD